MDSIVFEAVSKVFRHRPALFNWFGKERAGETCALHECSFHLTAGNVLVLLGPNGSGKTTTLKLISTMLLPDRGRVIVNGADSLRQGARVRRQVGLTVAAERSFVARLTARENLDFFAALDDVPRRSRAERIDHVLERTVLSDVADMLTMKFSAGMYQRLAIARALLKDPAVLLLDEPTRSLDATSASDLCAIVRELRRRGQSVVVATHNFDEAAALGDYVAVLDQGRLAVFQKIRSADVHHIRSLYLLSGGHVAPLPLAVGSRG
jgi:ABC-2 type transport system ATP-binding protein